VPDAVRKLFVLGLTAAAVMFAGCTSAGEAPNHPPFSANRAATGNATPGRLLSADPASYEVAFEANNGSLWTVGSAGWTDWNLGMAAQTGPSIASLVGGGYEVAFQANNGSLWTVGTGGDANRNLGMAARTSPSIASLTGGGYEVAFQGADGQLGTVGPGGATDWNLGMAAQTGPTIAALIGGGYEVAFQADDGQLWTVGSAGWTAWGLGVAAQTSPAITSLPGGGYEVAFEGAGGQLWTVGTGGDADWNLGVAAGTTPSIAALPGGGFEVAFQASDGQLWTVGSAGWTAWNLGMAAQTSPTVTSLAGGGYEVAFQAAGGQLWTVGSVGDASWGLGMAAQTGPSISASKPLAGRIVAVDPGHNGGNAAAAGVINQLIWNGREWETCDTTGTETDSGYTEALFNFNVAEYLAADLQAEGATVVLTRNSNSGVGPCVTERAAIGNNARADAAISIHADGGPPSGSGFAVLEPVADGPNNGVIAASQVLGLDIRAAFQAGTGEPVSNYDGVDGIQPRNDLAGLNLTTVPKVLIECGNMRNSTDAAVLTSSAWQQSAAEALAAGLTAYLTQ
jgi:N-acetylmuramoyl-L-alanine amidase